jgi:tetratricopeptide (TPR) repeat protein
MPVPLRLITVGSLGLVYQTIGHPRAAIDAFCAAMALAEELDAADHVATSLGLSHLQLGDLDQARDLLDRALLSYRQVGSRNGEANVLSGLATLNAEVGRYDEAAYQATLALRIARDIEDRRIECDALLALGSVLHQRDDLDGARLRLTSAMDVGRLIGYERSSTARSGPQATWGSGTRRSRSGPASTRPSTATCRSSAWPPPAGTCLPAARLIPRPPVSAPARPTSQPSNPTEAACSPQFGEPGPVAAP